MSNDSKQLLQDIKALIDDNNRYLLDEIDIRIEAKLEEKLEQKLDEKLDEKLDARFGEFEKKMTRRMNEQVEELTLVINTSLNAVGEQLDDHEHRITRLEHAAA